MDDGKVGHWLQNMDHSSRNAIRTRSSPAGGVGGITRGGNTWEPLVLFPPPLPSQNVSATFPASTGQSSQRQRVKDDNSHGPIRASFPSGSTSKALAISMISQARSRYLSISSHLRHSLQLHIQGYYQIQHQPHPHLGSSHSYMAVGSPAAYQQHNQFTDIDFASATGYPPLLQDRQPFVIPFVAPPSSAPMWVAALLLTPSWRSLICVVIIIFYSQIPTSHNHLNELSPFSSLSTSASTSSSAGTTDPGVCRQAQPLFNQQTQQWSCSGCGKSFSDKYGTDRHIATVGLKVTCRYCGSRVSALEFSRRRHFQRESCRKQGIQRGFTTRNEEDAFVEDL